MLGRHCSCLAACLPVCLPTRVMQKLLKANDLHTKLEQSVPQLLKLQCWHVNKSKSSSLLACLHKSCSAGNDLGRVVAGKECLLVHERYASRGLQVTQVCKLHSNPDPDHPCCRLHSAFCTAQSLQQVSTPFWYGLVSTCCVCDNDI